VRLQASRNRIEQMPTIAEHNIVVSTPLHDGRLAVPTVCTPENITGRDEIGEEILLVRRAGPARLRNVFTSRTLEAD
jgi:hypothetical protein